MSVWGLLSPQNLRTIHRCNGSMGSPFLCQDWDWISWKAIWSFIFLNNVNNCCNEISNCEKFPLKLIKRSYRSKMWRICLRSNLQFQSVYTRWPCSFLEVLYNQNILLHLKKYRNWAGCRKIFRLYQKLVYKTRQKYLFLYKIRDWAGWKFNIYPKPICL